MERQHKKQKPTHQKKNTRLLVVRGVVCSLENERTQKASKGKGFSAIRDEDFRQKKREVRAFGLIREKDAGVLDD